MILDKRADLGHGDVKKLLFSLSVPTITSQIVNMLYNLVDRVFIGHMQPAARRAPRSPRAQARAKNPSASWETA